MIMYFLLILLHLKRGRSEFDRAASYLELHEIKYTVLIM